MKKIIEGFLSGIGFVVAVMAISYIGLTSMLFPSVIQSGTFEVSSAVPTPGLPEVKAPSGNLTMVDFVYHFMSQASTR